MLYRRIHVSVSMEVGGRPAAAVAGVVEVVVGGSAGAVGEVGWVLDTGCIGL